MNAHDKIITELNYNLKMKITSYIKILDYDNKEKQSNLFKFILILVLTISYV